MASSRSSSTSVARSTDDKVSNAGSSTPPTSNTDSGSLSTNDPDKESSIDSRRVKRARRSLVSNYNENVMSGTQRRASSKASRRDISGDTLVNGAESKENSRENLITTGGEDNPPTGVQRSSSRVSMFSKAKGQLSRTVSVLGKRGRDALDTGKQNAKGLKQGIKRRASLRPRLTAEERAQETSSEPVRKKTRFSEAKNKEEEEEKEKQQAKAKAPKRWNKIWLAQGLYVGQERGFDPRLTEKKNEMKVSKVTKDTNKKPNRVLPLPMFGGQRLLDTGRDFRLPFDVFNPLPPGQPKPEEWRKTQKNVFVGDAASIWKQHKLQESSRCICDPEDGCNDDCHNRYMFYECDENNCNIGADRCTNRSFSDLKQRCKAGGKYNIGVEVCKTADRGYGVRSNRTFAPNQIIVEYAGEIITQDECEDRMNTMYKDNECYYLMVFEQNMIIDATRGSIARFVNHSCEPNCRIEKWTVADKPRMALFAGERGIMTGEELSYDYNFDPFSVKNVQTCRCGTASCRGVLGPKPKETKTVLDTVIGHAKTAKRKLGEALGSEARGTSRPKLTKRRKIGPTKVSKSSKLSIKPTKTVKSSKSSTRTVSETSKPKRGRPSKADKSSTRKVPTSLLAGSLPALKRGRPSKADLQRRALLVKKATQQGVQMPAKRPRGRPRKIVQVKTAVKSKVKDLAGMPRGRGRPPKVKDLVGKPRGRGRPPKVRA